ncbi:MAG: ferrous iron transport protein B [Bacteroidales bacterium]|jgi:ferrous iron transport protein B|nr:ferrous iron transport protein B [Bacteroidales bacterium]
MNNENAIKYLIDLQDNETAVINKVKGYGAFRKRITEMGFVRGTRVKAIKRAPLQDPIEYELMGYRVSLRKSEASMIEIIEESKLFDNQNYEGTLWSEGEKLPIKDKGKTIQVALVGNPNCGKTTIFNRATGKHERVGNYSGVTVDIKTAHFNQQDYRIDLTDLPGTYSISEYSPEELFVRKHLSEDMPDVVINVVDASNLERNLFLTTQLIDMNIRVIIALNMYDELQAKGDSFDYQHFSKMTGIPIVPTVASKGKGIGTLLDKVIDVYEENSSETRHIHINYGEDLNTSIQRIKAEVKKHNEINDVLHSQYVAIKLLEDDKNFTRKITSFPHSQDIIQIAREEINRLEKKYNTKTETLITDAKYAFIRGALKETFQPAVEMQEPKGYKADKILTHKWLGIPLFLLFMWAMFQATFTLGAYPMQWIEEGVLALGNLIQNSMQEGMLRDLLVDGIIGGVGGVIVFLPNILILFFCISLMEDTGYMARAAFIMDKVMHTIGLHGKSFIPMLMGFGCGVPAIMATRTLDSRKDRILTMLIIPFMSCSARLPVYILLISAFFPHNQGLILLSIYAIGILIAALTAVLFNKIFFRKANVPFVMELPPYRLPTLRNIGVHTWNKSILYLSKMGTIILVASILIWALGYFPRTTHYSQDYDQAIAQITQTAHTSEDLKIQQIDSVQLAQASEHLGNTYLGRLGHFLEPAIAPLGFDWKIGVSIVTGIAAKEIVVSSMGVLYQSNLEAFESSVNLQRKLQEQTYTSGAKAGQKVFTPLVAYGLMLFILLYFPCIAAMAAIRRESGTKWAIFTALYTTSLAWVVTYIVYNAGNMLL